MDDMTYDEFLGWLEYFKRRPEGWREDFRTARIMNAFGVKETPSQLFPSVAAVLSKPASENPMENSFKGSMMFHKMLAATGGDKLQFD